jgi:hypothetical protein
MYLSLYNHCQFILFLDYLHRQIHHLAVYVWIASLNRCWNCGDLNDDTHILIDHSNNFTCNRICKSHYFKCYLLNQTLSMTKKIYITLYKLWLFLLEEIKIAWTVKCQISNPDFDALYIGIRCSNITGVCFMLDDWCLYFSAMSDVYSPRSISSIMAL